MPLLDYAPDFVAEFAEGAQMPALKQVANRSYQLIRKAVAPAGLIYQIAQPGVETILPGLNLQIFSPNDVVQVSSSAIVGNYSAKGLPDISRNVLEFALEHHPNFAFTTAAAPEKWFMKTKWLMA